MRRHGAIKSKTMVTSSRVGQRRSGRREVSIGSAERERESTSLQQELVETVKADAQQWKGIVFNDRIGSRTIGLFCAALRSDNGNCRIVRRTFEGVRRWF